MLKAANCSYLHTKIISDFTLLFPRIPRLPYRLSDHDTANNLPQRLIQAFTQRRQDSGCNSNLSRRQASAQAGVRCVDISYRISYADTQKLAGPYPTSIGLRMLRLTTKKRFAGSLLLAQYVSYQTSLGITLMMIDCGHLD